MEERECDICGSDSSKRNRMVTCGICNGSACRSCWERWVLGSTEEKCMYPSCGVQLTNRFFFENFTKTFVAKTLKSHREDCYFERERALLPATQELVELEIREETWKNITRNFNKQHMENTRTYNTVRNDKIASLCQEDFGILLVDVFKKRVLPRENTYWNSTTMGIYGEDNVKKPIMPPWARLHIATRLARKIKGPMRARLLPLIRSIRDGGPVPDFLFLAGLVVMRGGRMWFPRGADWFRYHRDHFAIIDTEYHDKTRTISIAYIADLEKVGLQRRAPSRIAEASTVRFTRACPKESCKGYLNSAWNCGLCKTKFCKECHVEDTENHICNDDDIATAKLIMSETKPCPGCSISVTKLDGCDQMWCTQCRTAWDWKTGRIQTRVHNPHYFEYLRSRGGDENQVVAPRNPDEIRCGREFDHAFISSFYYIMKRLNVDLELNSGIASVIAGWNELNNNATDRNLGDSPDTQQLRIDYMRGKLTEAEFKKRVQMKHKKWNKDVEIRDLVVMLKQTIIEIMYRLRYALDHCEHPSEVDQHRHIFDEIIALEDYANDCLSDISKRYQSVEMGMLIRQRVRVGDRYVSVGLYNKKRVSKELEALLVMKSN